MVKQLNSVTLLQLEGPSTKLRLDKQSWEIMALGATVSERPCLTAASVSKLDESICLRCCMTTGGDPRCHQAQTAVQREDLSCSEAGFGT